jgi:hypothetical protein
VYSRTGSGVSTGTRTSVRIGEDDVPPGSSLSRNEDIDKLFLNVHLLLVSERSPVAVYSIVLSANINIADTSVTSCTKNTNMKIVNA